MEGDLGDQAVGQRAGKKLVEFRFAGLVPGAAVARPVPRQRVRRRGGERQPGRASQWREADDGRRERAVEEHVPAQVGAERLPGS